MATETETNVTSIPADMIGQDYVGYLRGALRTYVAAVTSDDDVDVSTIAAAIADTAANVHHARRAAAVADVMDDVDNVDDPTTGDAFVAMVMRAHRVAAAASSASRTVTIDPATPFAMRAVAAMVAYDVTTLAAHDADDVDAATYDAMVAFAYDAMANGTDGILSDADRDGITRMAAAMLSTNGAHLRRAAVDRDPMRLAGTVLYGTHRGRSVRTGRVTDDGMVTYRGATYDVRTDLSALAGAVVGSSRNGWTFWRVDAADGPTADARCRV